ncbi:MAG: C-type lectin domain-containing protein, partial [Clostridia bacterium]|nr:C-type lectin domain-containing protein [Clostridia bacterium]
NGQYYIVCEDSSIASWEDAVAVCEGLGGYLATITSDEENSFLYNYITGKGYTGAYFGLTDSETEGAWVWQNGESVSYTNWANDEPNNMYDNGEDYAMFYYKYTDGTWNDGDFDEETGGGKAFICEWGEYTNAAVSETESLFEILPSTFTFTSGAVWETTITLNDDGTFTGEYFAGYASASLEDGTVLSGGQQYLCNFSGKFSEPEYVSEYIYSMKLEYIDIEVEPGTEYVENDTLYTYTDPYGFDDADEFLIYLPGCPLDEVKEEFLSWTDISTENRTTMPTGVYGIYNINGEEGFVADDNSSIYHKSYSYSYNSYSSFLSSNFYSKGYLSFKPDSGASIINLIFDWGDENEREFAASDYNGTGDYIISLDFNEDYTSVMITVQSLSGYSLELWGGTSDGTLIAEYSLES